MKKYFSLIAVAMIALSTAFTSCSNEGSGSTFDPDLGQTQTNASANTLNSSAAASTSTSIVGTWTHSYETNKEGYTSKDSTIYTFTSDGHWTRKFICDQSGDVVIPGTEHREHGQSGTYTFDASKNTLTLVQVDGIMNAGTSETQATVTHTAKVNGNTLTIDGCEYTMQK